MKPPPTSKRRVVVIGGGFAGLHASKALRRAAVEIVLIDRSNHHLFQPLLYQVATAGLSPNDIARPLRQVFARQGNVTVLMGEVVELDPQRRLVRLHRGEAIAYDWLIVAVGSRHSYFGRTQWESCAPGLKTLRDALDIRERLLLAFERAERAGARKGEAPDPRDLTFVVVGGGPTGVEMAGAFAEIAHRTLRRNFRFVDPKSTKVYLVEAQDDVLPPFPTELRRKAREQLEEIGVEVLTNAMVVDVDQRGVLLEQRVENGGDGTRSVRIDSHTVIWAAGNEVPRLLEQLGTERDRQGRVLVGPDLSVPGRPEILVVGDAARFLAEGGEALPGLAPVAIQQGEHAARVIRADLDRSDRPPFHYTDRGTMATIGKARAVAWIHRWRFGGVLAWLAWSLVHILFLVGYRNRISVLLEWIYLYLTNQRGARLLYGEAVTEVEER
jgi:NADH dehydrogenase